MIQELLGPLPSALATRLPRGAAVVKKPTKSLLDVLGNRKLPDGALDFLQRTLHVDPSERLSADQCLHHAFLKRLFDAEQQAHNRTRRRHSRTPDEDGIEEEIPGEKTAEAQQRKAITPEGKATRPQGGPRLHDVKDDDERKGRARGERSTGANSQHHHARATAKGGGDNNNTPAGGGADGDDIEEIIEEDDWSAADKGGSGGGGNGNGGGRARRAAARPRRLRGRL